MKTSRVYKIILADDHILLRDTLATFIASADEFEVIAKADTGKALITLIEEGAVPDLVILDLNMPAMDGFDTAKWLKKNFPEIKILILTMYDSEDALIRLLHEGVRGFLKKDIHPHELKIAILCVIENGYYYSNSSNTKFSKVLFKQFESNKTVEQTLLNPKEIEFLKLAGSEMTYKEIAGVLELSPRTIDHYREVMFTKLGVKSRVGMAIYAIKNGIISFE